MNVVFILSIIYPRTLTDLKAPFKGWEYISGAHHLLGVCKVMGFKTSTVETFFFSFTGEERLGVFVGFKVSLEFWFQVTVKIQPRWIILMKKQVHEFSRYFSQNTCRH